MEVLLAELEKQLGSGAVILAIDGGSASGKTTLAAQLQARFGCNVMHMDDFFLQPHQRTEARYREPGGNVDRERFLREVLVPLSQGRTVEYRRFDCGTQSILPGVMLKPTALTVIEGAYCMHPELRKYYDLSVFKTVTPELQRQRILKRNPHNADMFFSMWIPLELAYFEAFDIPHICDIAL